MRFQWLSTRLLSIIQTIVASEYYILYKTYISGIWKAIVYYTVCFATFGEVTSQYLWSQCDLYVVGQDDVLCEAKWWGFVALLEYKIESVGLRKIPYHHYLTKKEMLQ